MHADNGVHDHDCRGAYASIVTSQLAIVSFRPNVNGYNYYLDRPVPIMLEILPIILSRISQKFCPLFL